MFLAIQTRLLFKNYYHRRTAVLKDILSSPRCGAINRVDCAFSFPASRDFFENDIRTKANADPLGALGDLGWYCVRLGIIAFSRGNDIRFPRSCCAEGLTWTPDQVGSDQPVTVGTLTASFECWRIGSSRCRGSSVFWGGPIGAASV